MHLSVEQAAALLIICIGLWTFGYHVANAPHCRGCAKKVFFWQRHTADYFGPPYEGGRGDAKMSLRARNELTNHLHEGCR